jgi:hypothetical protein
MALTEFQRKYGTRNHTTPEQRANWERDLAAFLVDHVLTDEEVDEILAEELL